MLRQVSLENFKAFEKVSIDLGLITVLIGPNGTGKSSIAQSLMLLKQSKGQIELRLNGPYVFLGDYQDVVHKKGMPAPELPRQPSDIAITIAASVDEENSIHHQSDRFLLRIAPPGAFIVTNDRDTRRRLNGKRVLKEYGIKGAIDLGEAISHAESTPLGDGRYFGET